MERSLDNKKDDLKISKLTSIVPLAAKVPIRKDAIYTISEYAVFFDLKTYLMDIKY